MAKIVSQPPPPPRCSCLISRQEGQTEDRRVMRKIAVGGDEHWRQRRKVEVEGWEVAVAEGRRRWLDESMALRLSKNRERRYRGSEKWNPSHLLPWLEADRHYNTKRSFFFIFSLFDDSPLVKSKRTQEFAHSTTSFAISNLYTPVYRYRYLYVYISFDVSSCTSTLLSV